MNIMQPIIQHEKPYYYDHYHKYFTMYTCIGAHGLYVSRPKPVVAPTLQKNNIEKRTTNHMGVNRDISALAIGYGTTLAAYIF